MGLALSASICFGWSLASHICLQTIRFSGEQLQQPMLGPMRTPKHVERFCGRNCLVPEMGRGAGDGFPENERRWWGCMVPVTVNFSLDAGEVVG